MYSDCLKRTVDVADIQAMASSDKFVMMFNVLLTVLHGGEFCISMACNCLLVACPLFYNKGMENFAIVWKDKNQEAKGHIPRIQFGHISRIQFGHIHKLFVGGTDPFKTMLIVIF